MHYHSMVYYHAIVVLTFYLRRKQLHPNSRISYDVLKKIVLYTNPKKILKKKLYDKGILMLVWVSKETKILSKQS